MSIAQGPVLIAAGGTGGHMFPALALARELMQRGEPVAMVTDSRGARYLPPDIAPHVIAAASPSGSMIQRARGFARLASGTLQSLLVVRRLRPCALACFGGYASVPVGLAARLFGLPVLVHEQNAVFGKANRLLARFARTIALSFETTSHVPAARSVEIVVTGNPVRPGFRTDGGPFRAPAAGEPLRLLVIGGSQGARILSDVVPEALALLPETLRRGLEIRQQCRPEDLQRVRETYASRQMKADVREFFTDMPDEMSRAHLLVSRAGASSLTEIMATGRASILVPYAAAADDHQRANAEALAAAGGCVCILQRDLRPERLASELARLISAPQALEAMAAAARSRFRADAASALATAVLDLLPQPEAVRCSP